MASAKRKGRNLKTHPRVRGEDNPDDDFLPPDRPDRITESEAGSGVSEVIDFSKTEVVDTAGDKDEQPPSNVERRTEPTERAPPRRQEREDRASRRQARGEGESEEDAQERRSYSARVQKRIARERAVVNRERALREQADRALAEERTARQELAERVLKVERASTKVAADADVKSLKAQIEALKPQIATAVEAGETAKALDLQIKLGDLQADLKVKEYDLTLRAQNAAVVEENERKERQAAADAAKRGATAADGELPAEHRERSNEFIRANRHWWRRDKEAKAAAIEIDKEILADIADGELDFEAYSDEHFEELAERVHEDFPDLEICDLDREPYDFGDQVDDKQGDRDRDRRGARVANGNQRGTGARQANGNRGPTGRLGTQRAQHSDVELARQGKVVLTDEDFKEMRIFKLDPNNPEHKKRFAQERARTILAAEARGDDRGGR